MSTYATANLTVLAHDLWLQVVVVVVIHICNKTVVCLKYKQLKVFFPAIEPYSKLSAANQDDCTVQLNFFTTKETLGNFLSIR